MRFARLAGVCLMMLVLGAGVTEGRPYDGWTVMIVIAAGFLLSGLILGRWAASLLAFPWLLAMLLANGEAPEDTGEWALVYLAAVVLGACSLVGVWLGRIASPGSGLSPFDVGSRRLVWGGGAVAASVLVALLVFLEQERYTDIFATSEVHESDAISIDPYLAPHSESTRFGVLAGDLGYCVGNQRKPEGDRVTVSEGRQVVTVRVWVREFEEPNTCGGIGYSAPVIVELDRPLGGRSVIAERSGVEIWPSAARATCLLAHRNLIEGAERKELGAADSRDALQPIGALVLTNTLKRAAGPSCPPESSG